MEDGWCLSSLLGQQGGCVCVHLASLESRLFCPRVHTCMCSFHVSIWRCACMHAHLWTMEVVRGEEEEADEVLQHCLKVTRPQL